MPTPRPIGLAELIHEVKRELLSPDTRQSDPVPLFAVDQVDLELAVSLSRTGEAGINIQVLSLGGGRTRDDVQTIRVTLRPLRSREDLIADLRQRAPHLFEDVTERSQSLLKGGLEDIEP